MHHIQFSLAAARFLLLAVGLLLLSATAQAQRLDPFEGRPTDYQVQLTRYFKTPEQEKTARAGLQDSVRTFQQDTAWTPANLKARLDLFE
ncbi:hypothetical protein [Hymenobacter terrenus]|uniref:hypothetical protein n=1 Tax=Hymenobacter terrenus TaxID=1629124 RepID=UPI000AD7E8F8|nr:hypothetical protein [Hymenobacter terrenus]